MDFKFLDRLLNAIFVFNNKYKLLYLNSAATNIIGLTLDQIENDKYLNEYLIFDDPNIFPESCNRDYKSSISIYKDIAFKAQSGKVGIANVNIFPIDYNQQWLLEVDDISSEVNLRKQLVSRSKLASLGEVSAGIAHELNNPLTSVVGYAQIVREDLLACHAHKNSLTMLDKIKDAALRMVSVINDLRQFSQGVAIHDWMQVDITVPIKKTIVSWTEYMSKRHIIVTYKVEEDIPFIWGDSELLENVFQNLMTNSKDAFEKLFDGRENTIDIVVTKLNDGVEIIYADNAGGMSDDVKKHLFDPFFTTKDVQAGAGLGMSLLYKIVQDHCGTINVETDLGIGTTFKIFFPKERRKALSTRLIKENSQGDLPDNLHRPVIMVVDDEEEICEIIDSYLSKSCDVVVYTDSRKAIQSIQEHKYDLILTDLKMPEATGMDILATAKEYQTDTPVVLISGHARADVEIKNALSAGALDVITKPFLDRDEFVNRICRYLE